MSMINRVVAERVAGTRHNSVSASSPMYRGDECLGGAELNVSVWHGKGWDAQGRIENTKADGDGMRFDSSDDAFAYALEHGYLRTYYTAPNLRLRRILRAQGFGPSYETATYNLDETDIVQRIACWKRTHDVRALMGATPSLIGAAS